MNVLQQIASVAKEHPEKVAYRSAGQTVTYGELWEQSNALAHTIKKMNLPKNSPITVYGHMSPKQIIAFLGVVKAGHPYIPLDISIPLERISHIVEASKSSFMITTEQFDLEIAVQQQTANDLIVKGEGAQNDPTTWVSEDEVFYIIYTSGSTGKPKGVQISESNLRHFVAWINEACSLPNGVYLNQAPYSFDLSVMDLYPALTGGRELHAITKSQIENAGLLFEELHDSSINVWTSTPSFAKICLMNPEWNDEQMPDLQTFLFCGEVLPLQVAKELKQRFKKATIYNLYGPTETTVAVTAVEVTDDMIETYEQLPIAPVDTGILKIMNEQMEEVTDGEKGELVIFGSTVSTSGYLYAEEQTNKVFKTHEGERIYKAGDLGYIQDGHIFYAGRSDFQIKLHGYRMEIEEIEKQIEALDEVGACVVLPVKSGEEVTALTACVALHNEMTEKPFKVTKNLKEKLLKAIPNYMVPKKFVYLDSLPLNMNGKVDRKRLAVEVGL